MTPARLLIVEDEAIVAKDLSARLSHLGYTVVGTAATGADAVEIAARLNPDLVLMDVHLSGIDGLEACQRIRSACSGTKPVVFLLSTYDAAEFAGRTAKCGAAAYLPKAEFGPELLAATWASVTSTF